MCLAWMIGCGGEDTVDGPADVGVVSDAAASDDGAIGDVPGDLFGGDGTNLPPCVKASDCPPIDLPCRVATCQPDVGCVPFALPDGAICDDGDPCSLGGLCKAGTCKPGELKSCDDGDPCTADLCDSREGCVHGTAADGTPCEDGNICTDGDACETGACSAGGNVCGCQTTADCADKDDGNPCNGTTYCDKSEAGKSICKVNPSTIIFCPSFNDTACLKNACAATSGLCKLTPVEAALSFGDCSVPGSPSCRWQRKPAGAPAPVDIVPCDDGDKCTTIDHCEAGACVAGETLVCPCTSDAECEGKDDGNLCNGTMFCDTVSGKCLLNPASVVSCQTVDDTMCLQTECNPNSGLCQKVPMHEGDACDDGVLCTSGEVCKGGTCKPAAETCSCKTDAECTDQDDGDLCNGTMFCNPQSGKCEVNPATKVNCPTVDDTFCQLNSCLAKAGACAIVPRHEGLACDDGNPCTANEACSAGQCVATANTCECQKDSDCAPKDDGNQCNGTLFCEVDSGLCKVNPATVVQCSPTFDNACQVATCQAKTGACVPTPVNQGNPCDDGDPCTVGEACHQGSCKADAQANLCECHFDADCGVKEDGNFCNGTLYCDKGALPWVCAVNPATVVPCQTVDDSFCLHNVCQPKTGQCAMEAAHVGLACDDGSKCSTDDVCKAGKCAGLPVLCTDDQPCTKDGCDDAQGCVFAADDSACNDASPCTDDFCSVAKGCLNVANVANCEDGSVCTTGDTCKAGQCVGSEVDCDDDDACTDDSCDAKSGCQHGVNTATCKTGLACQPKGTCNGGACEPEPSVLHATWLEEAGPQGLAALLPLPNGDLLLVGDTAAGDGPEDTADLRVARLDRYGKTLWTKALAGGADEHAEAAVGAGDQGGVAVGTISPGPGGGQDAYLVRFGQDGAVKWKQVAGGAGDDSASAVAIFGKDELIAAGRDGSDDGKGAAMWLARLSPFGTVLWQQTLGGANGRAAAVVRLADGFALAGRRTPDGGVPFTVIARTDEDGKALWDVELNEETGAAHSLLALADGGLIAGGWRGLGQADARLVRLDVTGEVLWDQLYGGDNTGRFTALRDAGSGSVAVAGLRVADGKPALWLARIDHEGTPIWERSLVGVAAMTEPKLAILADGGSVIGAVRDGGASGDDAGYLRTDPWGYLDCAQQGDCALKDIADCDDSNPCTHDFCLSLLGCTHTVHTLPCNDGNPCTEDDACAQGGCGAGSAESCDDGNTCTDDACDLAGGCTHTVLAGDCTDGDACTKGDVCVGGLCKPGPFPDCADGSACTDDTCDPLKGCVHEPNVEPCQSGNCTWDDTCVAGFCKTSGMSRYVEGWYGSDYADKGYAVAAAGDGGYVVAGTTWRDGHADGVIVRTDAAAKQTWETEVKGPTGCCGSASSSATSTEQIFGLVPTPFGYLAVGYSSLCYTRAMIVRLDHAGKIAWQKLLHLGGGGGVCHVNSVRSALYAVVPGYDGTWAAVGWRQSYSFTEGHRVGLFVRYNKDGQQVSQASWNGGPTLMRGLTRASDSSYLAVGQTAYAGVAGSWDGYAVRANSGGTAIWSKRWGGAKTEILFAADTTLDGGFVMVGQTESSGAGNHDAWVVRTDIDGNIAWQRTFGGLANDFGYGVHMADGGTFAVSGTTWSQGPGQGDWWLFGLDETGNRLWERVYGLPGEDDARALGAVGGGYALAGFGLPAKASEPKMHLLTTDAFGYASCADSGTCQSVIPWDCEDGDVCTADACDKLQGCVHPASTFACDDGSACTGADGCKGGECVGAAVDCDDKNPCTADTCDAMNGCAHKPAADGSSCGDAKTCLGGTCN